MSKALNKGERARPSREDKIIGENIRTARRAVGWSLDDLGAKINLSGQQVSKYETGDDRVRASTLGKIAKVFGKPVAEFYQ